MYSFKLIILSLVFTGVFSSSANVFKSAVRDWVECALGDAPTSCLEARTGKTIKEINDDLMEGLSFDVSEGKREGKNLDGASDTNEVGELDPLEAENQSLMKKIEERQSEGRGIVDDIGDLFTYVSYKILNPFSSSSSDAEESDEVSDDGGKVSIEERGHKKKELKKKNKQLKLILLLMLLKNKIKMFVNKLQFLVQLKFLLVATVNMLANVIRLWIELKKKHKPNKVVYYEHAHHQHNYDNEHYHDEGPYSYTGSHSHHAHHHEDDDYGGGPWPWSRNYVEKSPEQSYSSYPYRRYPGRHSLVYMNQRPLR